MNKIKILFAHYAIIDKEGFGRTFMLARELAYMGHDVTMLTTLPSGSFVFPFKKEIREGVKIYAFPDLVPDFFRRTGFGFLSLILKILFSLFNKFEIVHGDNGHRPSSGIPCRINRLVFSGRYVTEWWDFFGKGGQYDELSAFKKYTKGAYDLLTEIPDKKRADFVVVLSGKMRERALSCGIATEKIAVIHGGADTRNISCVQDTNARKKTGNLDSALTFGFIGMNEGEFSDLIPFVEAVHELKGRITVNWFTTGRKLSPEIRHEFHIGEELTEFGWVEYDRYSQILSCADVFLLTQKDTACNQTRWPNKAGDYLAAGRIILTNPVGDIVELAARPDAAIITCDFKKESMIDAIVTLFNKRYELIPEGRANRILAEELSWQSKAAQLEKIYKQLLDKR